MAVNFNDQDFDNLMFSVFKLVEKVNPGYADLADVISQKALAVIDFLVLQGGLPSDYANKQIQPKIIDELIKCYEEKVGVKTLEGFMLSSEPNRDWLACRNIEWKSWELYKRSLQDSGKYQKVSIDAIDKISSDVMNQLGDPLSDRSFLRKGLLMGDVQSGKTATYTAICHKALDAGYRLVILLTGTKETLRIQTQDRLNSDLCGLEINKSTGQQGRTTLGKNTPFTWNFLTTVENDFIKGKTDGTIRPDDPKEVTLVVTKKNSRILRNLYEWFSDTVGQMQVKSMPCLIVDDEADAASVNTNDPKTKNEATAINKNIRELLNYFDKVSYLAVTATPFANVFIDPQLGNQNVDGRMEDTLPDLFPSDFIYPMQPPEGYCGVERLFGELGEQEIESLKYKALIPISKDIEESEDAKKVHEGTVRKTESITSLPKSVKKSILYFLCACTFTNIDSQRHRNMSMLIHIARYKNFHTEFARLVSTYVDEVRQLALLESARRNYTPTSPIYRDLEELWDKGCGDELWYADPTHGTQPPTFKQLSGFTWNDVWKKRFYTSIKDVVIVKVNSDKSTGEFLGQHDLAKRYESKNAKIIAIGGDALSRGLTLEGLCVTYFSRTSGMYDTLLQMGRWFGYRGRDERFMKIWISEGLITAFEFIASALAEFRDALFYMKKHKRTPLNFGLKIRRAPRTVKLLITAKNKMHNASKEKKIVNVGGELFQAAHLPLERESRDENLERVSEFLRIIGTPYRPFEKGFDVQDSTKNDLVWEEVSGEQVAALVKEINVYGWSMNFESDQLANCINKLFPGKIWRVRVISLGDKENSRIVNPFNVGEVRATRRTFYKMANWIAPTKSAILSPRDFARHWSRERCKDAHSCMPLDVLLEPSEKPQLLIYPMVTRLKSEVKSKSLGSNELFESDEVIPGLVIGFPDAMGTHGNEMIIEYESNRVYQISRTEGFVQGEEDDE